MEYARMYLIKQAVSEREHRECELVPPTRQWFWAPYWEKFLIVPKIPSTISRDRMSRQSLVRPLATVGKSMEAGKPPTVPAQGHCPRLSLNLGPSVAGFPSLMDLKLASDRKSDESDESPTRHEEKASHDTSHSQDGDRKLSDANYPMPPDHTPPPVPVALHREMLPQLPSAKDSQITVPSPSEQPDSDTVSTHSSESVETVIHVTDTQSSTSETSELTVIDSNTRLGTDASMNDSCQDETPSVLSHEEDCLVDLRPAPLNLTRRLSRQHVTALTPESKHKNATSHGLELPRPDSPTIDVPDIRGQVALNQEPAENTNNFMTRAASPPPGTLRPLRSRQPTYKLVPTVKRTSFVEATSPILRPKALSPDTTPKAPSIPAVPALSSEETTQTQSRSHYVPPFLDISRNRLAPSREMHHKASSERLARHIPLMRAAARNEDDMQPYNQSQERSTSQGNAFHLRKRQDTGQATILPSVNNPVPVSPTKDSRQLYGQPNCNFSFTTRPAITALGDRDTTSCMYDTARPATRLSSNPEKTRTGSGTAFTTTNDPKTPSKNDGRPKETRRTPSRLASIFRRREDLVHVPEKISMPPGPVSPGLASPWRPFEESLPDDNVFGATWMYSDERNWANNEDVIAARRQEMMARQQGPKRLRRLSFGRSTSGSSSSRTSPDALTSTNLLKTGATAELKVDFQHFLQNMPSPPPATSLPPVPSPGTRTPSRTASTRPPRAPSAVYKDKKPKGLGIATDSGTTATSSDARNRLRKASKDSLRSASAASASGSSRLKDVFRLGDRQFSLGKTKEVRSKVDDGEPRSVFEED
ncbi:hypothetical protein CC79DRAFT_1366359 [Sarocladium strictum]